MNLWVITACLNEHEHIEKHMKYLNFLSIKYNINYVISDGGSSDGSLHIIKGMMSNNSILIENGGSIYQSWNLAIDKIYAVFSHLVFLGVNDEITEDFIKKIMNIRGEYDLLYAGIIIDKKKYPIKSPIQLDNWIDSPTTCMSLHHCGTIFSRRLFVEIGLFSTKYKIASDLDWMLKIKTITDLKIYLFNDYGVLMRGGGISNSSHNSLTLIREEFLISIKNKLIPCPKRFIFNLASLVLNFINKIFKHEQCQ